MPDFAQTQAELPKHETIAPQVSIPNQTEHQLQQQEQNQQKSQTYIISINVPSTPSAQPGKVLPNKSSSISLLPLTQARVIPRGREGVLKILSQTFWSFQIHEIFAILFYVGFILCSFTDTISNEDVKAKYLLMDPITKVWVAIGKPISQFLLPFYFITPDFISYLHLVIAFISSLFIVSTNRKYRLVGFALYVVRNILDSTDGALARSRSAMSADFVLSHQKLIDTDFLCDAGGALFYGIAIVLWFWRTGITHPRGYSFFFGMAFLTVFLKGFIMDSLMELYGKFEVTPSLLSSFLWKLSSYDSWDNLKLFALVSMTEFPFYYVTAFFGLPWVFIPTFISLAEIYLLN